MNEQLITYVFSNISFGVLFVWLLFDTRKDSKEREKKYHKTIKKRRYPFDEQGKTDRIS